MIQICKKEKCCGCSACAQKCPQNAIEMKKDQEGFLYPTVYSLRCVECGLCENVCPEINAATVFDNTQVYACYRRDFAKRIQSASGGIFAVMAESILKDRGVVFGAAFDENWMVRHIAVEQIEQLPILLGSKYVQSVVGETYKQAEKALKEGRKVLFSGTPCQIQGLHKYLGRSYENLFSVDLICHGAPSNDIWQLYLKEISKGRKIKSVVVRDKSNGIDNAPMVFRFDNGELFQEKYNKNTFLAGFNKNLYLRPSCYACPFKGINRCSDMTIGDFWGLSDFKPDFGDQYGVSALLLHTQKGKNFFDTLNQGIENIKCDVEMIIPQNPCLVKSVQQHSDRENFYELLTKHGFQVTVKKILRPSMAEYLNNAFKILRYYMWVIKQKIKHWKGK